MLRRALLAAAASEQIRRVVTATPATRAVVDRYVAGDSISDAVRVARSLRAAGLLVTLDYLGEDTTDARLAADDRRAVRAAARQAGRRGAHRGRRGRGLGEADRRRPAARRDGTSATRPSIERIAIAAREAGTTVTVDAEDHRTTDAGLRIATALRSRLPFVGSVVQAALRRTEADVRELAAPGVRVRLCKGAYAEPVSEAFAGRHDVDKSFAQVPADPDGRARVPDDRHARSPADRDHQVAGAAPAPGQLRVPDAVRGQAREQRRLAETGAQVRVYVPYGSDWYGYLVRRLAERPANLAFFLRSLWSVS